MFHIVHLSDFHLNKQNLSDWIEYISPALVQLIHEKGLIGADTIVACTGDLIDKAGRDFSSPKEAFDIFEKQVINDIINKTSFPKNHFLIIPGNHDIDRSLDSEFVNLGMNQKFQADYQAILDFVKNVLEKGNEEGIQRIIPFKEFETSLYKNESSANISLLGSSFIYDIQEQKIGVACFNSAWHAYDDDDKNHLVLGEQQVNKSLSYLKDCDVRIALIHHPLDWFKLETKTTIHLITQGFDILLVGHVHDSDTTMQLGMYGAMFINVAPSFQSEIRSSGGKAFANGVTIITYDNAHKLITSEYYTYNFKGRKYVPNTQLGDAGVLELEIPNQNLNNLQRVINDARRTIEEDFYPRIDEQIIPNKANIVKTLKEAFIMPPIQDGITGEENGSYMEVTDIIRNSQNQIFFGPAESGRTTLLYRLLQVYMEDSYLGKIPIYIDVNESSGKEIITIIKDFLKCSTDNANLLVGQKAVVFLVDNMDFEDQNEYFIKRLQGFIRKNDGIQIKATAGCELTGVTPTSFLKNTIAFEQNHLLPFRSSHIKNMLSKWMPEADNLDYNRRLDKMVSSFCSYSLPSTAMSVSLFLWCEHTDRKPINQAVLLDIYVELILEKMSSENIYRAHLDYKNKTMLLANIAEKMLDAGNSNYIILYSEYLGIIHDYLKKVGYDQYDANAIGSYFIIRKIFTKVNGNHIKFSHSCFFHFFLAKRMIDNAEFRECVFHEDQFFKFPREIDYYSGLTRTDKKALEEIYGWYKKASASILPILNAVDIDDFFTNVVKRDTSKKEEPIAKQIDTSKIKANRPTEEKMLSHYDEQLAQIPDDVNISTSNYYSLDKVIVIMSNILRNSEGVEDVRLKQDIYHSIVNGTIAWAIVFKEMIVRYYIEHKHLPPIFSDNTNLEWILKTVPLGMFTGLQKHLGTHKLTSVFYKKIEADNRDKECSDIEKFFSVGLYWENNGEDYVKYINKFISSVGNNVVQVYLIVKLIEHLYFHTKSDSREEDTFLKLLTKLKLKHDKLPARMTNTIREMYRDKKKEAMRKEKMLLKS
ncbi:MAG: metallophosphoesterase [Culturomica sp.]|jgi:hypothetical protein|nr:metallophosphoesterase [Culturomica sp.]